MDYEDKQRWYRLDARVDDISTKLAALDAKLEAAEKAPKSATERLKAVVPLVAIVISIAAAGFTYLDRFVNEPRRELRVTLNELGMLSRDMQLAYAEGTPEAQARYQGMLPQLMASLNKIHKSHDRFADSFSINDYLQVGNLSMQMGDYAKANYYADAALETFSLPIEQANAKILKARVLYGPSEIQNVFIARDLLDEAFQIAAIARSPMAFGVALNAMIDKFGLELSTNNCQGARLIVLQMADYMTTTKTPAQTRDFAQANFANAVRFQDRGCNMDISALAVK